MLPLHQPFSTRKNLYYFVFSLLLWIGSYLVVGFIAASNSLNFDVVQQVVPRSILTIIFYILFFLLPIIPLLGVLQYGKKAASTTTLKSTIGWFFGLLLAVPFITFIISSSQQGDTRDIGDAFLLSLIIAAAGYIFLQIIFVIAFFILQKKHPSLSTIRIVTVSFGIYCIIPCLLGIYIQYYNYVSSDRYLCTSTKIEKDLGQYGDFYFLTPLSKTELRNLMTKYHFTVRLMTLAANRDLANYLAFNFDPYYKMILNEQTMSQLITSIDQPVQFFVTNENGPVKQEAIIQAYEAGEPVIWSLEVQNISQASLIDLAQELDINQKRLGTTKYSSWNYDPRSYMPQTIDKKIRQADCYNYFFKKNN